MELDLKEFEALLNESLDIKPEPDPEGTDNEELKEELAGEAEVSYEEKLKEAAEKVKAEIQKIYGDDDLMEYFVVETHIGKYDDGTDKYSIEVRGELGYEAMTDLAIKLDNIVQEYDKYAYFDMVTGGIMEAVIEFNRQPYVAPFRIVVKATDIEEDILYYDTLEEAKDICAQILNGSKKDEIIKLNLEKLEDGEYKVIEAFKSLAQESLKEDKEEDLIRLQNEYDKEAENLPNDSKEMYALNKKYGKLKKKVNKHYAKCSNCKDESLNEEKLINPELEQIVICGSDTWIKDQLECAGFTEPDFKIETYYGKSRKYDGIIVTASEDDITSLAVYLDDNNYRYYPAFELLDESINEVSNEWKQEKRTNFVNNKINPSQEYLNDINNKIKGYGKQTYTDRNYKAVKRLEQDRDREAQNLKYLNTKLKSFDRGQELQNNKPIPPKTFVDWYGEDLSGTTYDGNLDCSKQKLTSLEGSPKIVNGYFNCSGNYLTNLNGAPETVNGFFDCSRNKINSLTKEDLPKIGGIVYSDFKEFDKTLIESLNEKYCTKAEITRFLKSHKATEVAFGRYISEIRGTEKLFEMHAHGSKKIAGTYDSFDLSVYPKGALYREELATGFGKVTTKYYIFGVEAENIDESLKAYSTPQDQIAIKESKEKAKNEDSNLRTDLVEYIENDVLDLTSTIDSLMVKYKECAANWDHEKQWSFCERIQEILQSAAINLENVSKRIK